MLLWFLVVTGINYMLYSVFYQNIYIIKLFYRWFRFILFLTYNKSSLTSADGLVCLSKYLDKLGVIGIKMGQYLYSRRDIVSPENKIYLERFLDSNNFHSLKETKKLLGKYYGDEIVAIIPKPIASGSIAQVYECKMWFSKKTYILKVLHPEIRFLDRQIKILRFIIKLASFMIPYLINIDWVAFFEYLSEQSDLRIEVQNMCEISKLLSKHDEIKVPTPVCWGKSFIVMTKIDGQTMGSLDKSSTEFWYATNLLNCAFLQNILYSESICHGDLHEGNVLWCGDGSIGLLDYGACIKVKEDQNPKKTLLAFFKAIENTTNRKNCKAFFEIFLEPYDTSSQPICIDEFVDTFIETMNLRYKTNDKNIMDFFNSIMSHIQRYGFICKSKMYFLSSVKSSTSFSSIFGISFKWSLFSFIVKS